MRIIQMREQTSTKPISTVIASAGRIMASFRPHTAAMRACDEGADRPAAAQSELKQRHQARAMRRRRHDLQHGAALGHRDASPDAPGEAQGIQHQERRRAAPWHSRITAPTETADTTRRPRSVRRRASPAKAKAATMVPAQKARLT